MALSQTLLTRLKKQKLFCTMNSTTKTKFNIYKFHNINSDMCHLCISLFVSAYTQTLFDKDVG